VWYLSPDILKQRHIYSGRNYIGRRLKNSFMENLHKPQERSAWQTSHQGSRIFEELSFC